MRTLYLIFIFSLSSVCLFAVSDEQIRKIKNVRGQFGLISSSSSLSIKQAVELAREDAKRKALEQAFESTLTTWDEVEISSKGENFNSLAINKTSGEIIEFDIIEEGHYQSSLRSVETIFYCVADVKVKRKGESDPNFRATIEGVNTVYYENDILEFSVIPHVDSYLMVFLYNELSEGYLIYPSSVEEQNLLKKYIRYKFPINRNIEYTITKDTDSPIELNRIVFVFTKNIYAFGNEVASRIEIETWLAHIPTSEKFIYSAIFDIRKR